MNLLSDTLRFKQVTNKISWKKLQWYIYCDNLCWLICKYDFCIFTNIFLRCQLLKIAFMFAPRECDCMCTPRLLDCTFTCALHRRSNPLESIYMMSPKSQEASYLMSVCVCAAWGMHMRCKPSLHTLLPVHNIKNSVYVFWFPNSNHALI